MKFSPPNMPSCAGLCLAVLALHMEAQTLDHLLIDEHVDFKVLYDAQTQEITGIVARDEDARTNFTADQAVLIVAESAKLTLPDNTPFGSEGTPLWVLPQSQDPSLLYLGVSAEDIPAGAFSGNLELRLVAVEGPGTFFAWQASSLGGIEIKMNSSDGIGLSDKTTPFLGSHEHLNWGFTQPGDYKIFLQAFATRSADGTQIQSPPTPFHFQVLPLPLKTPFQKWQARHWPFASPQAAPLADPDLDGIVNLVEYAFGLDPTRRSDPPQLAISVSTGAESRVQLAWSRNAEATDIAWLLESRDSLEGVATVSPIEAEVFDRSGTTESVGVTRPFDASRAGRQFYRLALKLQ